MKQLTTKPFPYYVGVYSLEELATRDSRVCVINILGSESRKVTPVSHEYSGGNVVAGVQYGRTGEIETKIGNIPYYRSVRDVMANGHEFDIGVIYLPPAAVSQAVWELVRFNKQLKRIIIITEKVSTRDSRNIRFTCQEAGVDVIGANCLGIANAWDHVRIGGALGGDHPEESLHKGSVAIHSNSGNFTTTIAQYLQMAGFGVSTAVSSGKDVYVHFALAEFLFAAQNDPRTKVVALYVEPGGYYEKQALEWIKERRFGFNKPIVVCVTGRWKKYIARSCGHAGAMAGSGDDAESKELWFDDYFEKGVFDPDNPDVSKKGIRVSSIQHFPEAMKAVYKKMDEKPDFQETGDLSLKLWISDNLLKLPEELEMKVTEAISPYNEQIREINKQVGALFLRQNMRNKSGASQMDKKKHIAQLHGTSVLDLAQHSIEENLYYAIAKVFPNPTDTHRMNLLLSTFTHMDDFEIDIIKHAQTNGCTPNATLAARIAMIGKKSFIEKIRAKTKFIIDVVRNFSIFEDTEEFSKALDKYVSSHLYSKKETVSSEMTEVLLKEVMESENPSPSLLLCRHMVKLSEDKNLFIEDMDAFLIASLIVCMFWNPMLGKRISRQSVEEAGTYIYLVAQTAVGTVINPQNNNFWKNCIAREKCQRPHSFTRQVFEILFNRKPDDVELLEFQYLMGLTITNGPGTLSAKGAKESVSAKNDIPTIFTGFLTNTGYAHGGNGFEAIAYLYEKFDEIKVKDPGTPDKTLKLQDLANKAAKEYGKYKQHAKELGQLNYKRIPCINHPVFKGNDVNIDPREDFVYHVMKEKEIYNVFWEFYHILVKELYNEGVTANVFCVNIDAVLAVNALKLIWKDLKENRLTLDLAQNLVFALFLVGRSVGTVAEIIDHRDRGTVMDCRTPQSEVSYVL